MNCNCIELINKELEGDNAEIASNFWLDFETGESGLSISMPVRRIDTSKRNKLPSLAINYCPACGKSARRKKKKAKRKTKKKKAKA